MEVETPISGRIFWQSLPEEIRNKLPPRCKRIVIDIPHNGAVRVLYEAYGTESVGSAIEAALTAGYVEHPPTRECSEDVAKVPNDH